MVSVSMKKPIFFEYLQIPQDLNNKKIPKQPFLDIGKWGTCAKFQQLFDSWSSS